MQPSGVRQAGAEFSGWSHPDASCVVLLLGNLPEAVAGQLCSSPEGREKALFKLYEANNIRPASF